MLKKARLYSLLLIIVLSTIVSIFPFTDNVFAEQTPEGFNDKRVLEDAKASAVYNMAAYCLYYSINDKVSSSDLSSGNWFKNIGSTDARDRVAVSRYVDPNDDGYLSCNDENQSVAALIKDTFGWSTYLEAACNLGFRPEDHRNYTVDECIENPASNSSYMITNDTNNLDILQGGTPRGENETGGFDYNDIQRYMLYKYTLDHYCDAKPLAVVATNEDPDLADLALGATEVMVANAGEAEPYAVYYEIGSGEEPISFRWNDRDSDEVVKCSDLPGKMNETVGAYADWLGRSDPQPEDDLGTTGGPSTPGGSSSENSTCQIQGIGWIVCPLLTFMAEVTDSVYSILDRVFLRLPPVNMDLSDEENGMYRSWKMMRDFANIIFVIAFLLIVFSQITSLGISNYGLKRLVPKLIIAAILVNLSYFICAIAVDVSNILGSSLKDLLDGASNGILKESSETAWNNGGGFRAIVATAIATSLIGVGLVTWATLPLVAAALLFVLPIAVTVLLTMVVRQALVVLLIVISPLAFVALLFPNTEGYFKKWQDLFKAMLLLYPIIALVFGAAALASTVLMAAAKDAGDLQALHEIAAAAVRVLPLVFIPAMIKISSGVFGRVTGMVNDKQKGWFDNVRNTRMDNHKFDLAERAQQRGRDGSRIRAFDRFTPYGSAIRAGRKRDRNKQTESMLEGAYLGSEEGQATRNAAENARQNLQTAEINAETVRIESPEGIALQQEQVVADSGKKTAEDNTRGTVLDNLAASGVGPTIWKGAEDAKNKRTAAENNAAGLGTQLADRSLAARAEESGLIKEGMENNLHAQAAPLVSQTARTFAANSGLNKTIAENRVSTATAQNTSGTLAGQVKETELQKLTAENNLAISAADNVSRTVRTEAYESGLAKDSVESRKEAAAIRAADSDLKVQSEASSELLGAAKNEVKQAYEEAVAGTPPAGVAAGSTAQAQAARKSSNVTSAQTDSAKRVSEDAFSDRVLGDTRLAAEMGGIDPNGADRQEARAAASKMRAHKEIVDNKISLLEYNGTDSGTLYKNATNMTLPVEDQEANAILLTRNGGDNQIDDFYDYIVTMPASPLRETLQQQFAANVGSRKSQAIGEADMDKLRAGKQDTTIKEGWRRRAAKLSGSGAASMSQDRLQSLLDSYSSYFSGSLGDPTLETNMKAFSNSIKDFKSSPNFKNLKPPKEILDKIDAIEALIDTNIP